MAIEVYMIVVGHRNGQMDKTLGLSADINLPYYHGQKRSQFTNIDPTPYLT
jgi:hypothetical protein